MDYGELFCKIAFDALDREERELDELIRSNRSARPMSVSQADEVTLHWLITKEAMRDGLAPRIKGEVPYVRSRQKADICFIAKDGVCASFEVKKVSIEDEKQIWPDKIRQDARKLFDPANQIQNADDGAKRYLVAVMISPDEISESESKRHISEATSALLTDIKFSQSKSIRLKPRRPLSCRLLEVVARCRLPRKICPSRADGNRVT